MESNLSEYITEYYEIGINREDKNDE